MTDNQASVVDEADFSVRRTIRIAAPVEKVWRAVTEPEQISRWFGRTELDGSGPGAQGSITFEGYGRVPLAIEAVDAPRSITYRWGNDDALGHLRDELDDHATDFTFTLEPVDGGTLLTVVERGFDRTSNPLRNLSEHAEGWVSELDKLVALLEGGA
ncbi:SRPBCC domain-containing protein [Agromyces sp. CF514]|uniref:SRPBCC domain-containing protein n=1 Tax=Agromyces sp. CF514 TaxID=1881031 RepID=UPI002101D229|nr:SRPBCC domain-containing protein [Agromyces sp. CF514]